MAGALVVAALLGGGALAAAQDEDGDAGGTTDPTESLTTTGPDDDGGAPTTTQTSTQPTTDTVPTDTTPTATDAGRPAIVLPTGVIDTPIVMPVARAVRATPHAARAPVRRFGVRWTQSDTGRAQVAVFALYAGHLTAGRCVTGPVRAGHPRWCRLARRVHLRTVPANVGVNRVAVITRGLVRGNHLVVVTPRDVLGNLGTPRRALLTVR